MILIQSQLFFQDIKKYCRMLEAIIYLPLKLSTEFSNTKEELFEETKKVIENKIFQLFDRVKAVDKLSIALFKFRSITKTKMYDDNLDAWTPKFKVCNCLFFLSLKYLKKSKSKIYFIDNEFNTLCELFTLVNTLLESQFSYNERYFSDDKEAIDNFYKRIQLITNKCGDMHSYEIKNSDLNKFLNLKNIFAEKIKQNALEQYKDSFITTSELSNDKSWGKITQHDNIKELSDDIIIIPTRVFNVYSSRIQNFISNFESEKCQNPFDPESELIFSYRTVKYFYISRKILFYTQQIFENFLAWGQYRNLTEYYWGQSVNEKTIKGYNRLMTYKIADLLIANNYFVPMITENKLLIPRIEIMNYSTDKRTANKLGDLDLVFYSKYTKSLYLIEYKNYQMIVSREGDLSAEVSKVQREKTVEKVIKRQEYICNNLEFFMNNIFKNKFEILDIKSIILTTKPCFYFYVNKPQGFLYMEWTEFEDMVLRNEL